MRTLPLRQITQNRAEAEASLYYRTKVIPCGLATGMDIGLSNLSLKTITLSFYSTLVSAIGCGAQLTSCLQQCANPPSSDLCCFSPFSSG